METGTTVLHSLHIFNTLDDQKKKYYKYSPREFYILSSMDIAHLTNYQQN